MSEDTKRWSPTLEPLGEKCGPSVFEEASRDMTAAVKESQSRVVYDPQMTEEAFLNAVIEISPPAGTVRRQRTHVSFDSDAAPVLRWGRVINPIIHPVSE